MKGNVFYLLYSTILLAPPVTSFKGFPIHFPNISPPLLRLWNTNLSLSPSYILSPSKCISTNSVCHPNRAKK